MTSQKLDFQIHFAQINPLIGDFKINSKAMLREIKYAKSTFKNNVLVIFPELSLCGYPPEDLLLSQKFIDDAVAAQKEFLEKLKKPKYESVNVIFGNIASTKDVKLKVEPSERLRLAINCAYFVKCAVENTEIKLVKIKDDLPNYGVFDEARYFESGKNVDYSPQIVDGISVSICEDIWNPPYSIPFDETVKLAVVINASPFREGKNDRRIEAVQKIVEKFNIHVAYCNSFGATDELVFDGGSFLMAPDGEITNEEQRIGDQLGAICIGLRNYFVKNGFTSAVLGLSGGIDSAVTAALAVIALGRNNVIGVMMPSKFSSQSSLIDAQQLAENLQIKTKTFPIQDSVDIFEKSFKLAFGDEVAGLTNQNLQARVRGQILMAYSNQSSAKGDGGCLVLATGNKSEIAVGYSTIYGDAVGGFAPLKDVYKTQVYDLAKQINSQWPDSKKPGFPIPQNSIDKAPSAELAPDQKDQDSLPEYRVLDDILKSIIDGYYNIGEVCEKYGEKLVSDVAKMVTNAEWKRKQYPIGPKLSAVVFGKDWRMPLSQNYVL